MTHYDFNTLSPFDFEDLIRDLIQKEFGVTLECFKSGRDNGIDFRYSLNPDKTLIVQCKHYVKSGYSKLRNHIINSELPKIKELKPSRYILATSVGLTPSNKDELLRILTPYCQLTSDILGHDDVNNLLGIHPDTEKKHFKLWLTSSAVLDKIVNGNIFTQTDIDLQRIRKKLNVYVQNESYFEAQKYLNDLNYCLIVGIPGIGKTTLAEILMVDYLDKGFQVIRICNDIDEAYKVHKPSIKQLFYYDDFLGQTSLQNKFNKNEELKFLQFIDWIQKSNNSKFIMTTREYILNQAKMIYEHLSRATFDSKRCIIDLSKYTRMDKAKILFNHVYFSMLNDKHKADLLKNKCYLKLIDHKNYSPRIIEWMTDYHYRRVGPEDNYDYVFLQSLDDPTHLWMHAFENQITSASQDLLTTLCLMPNEVFIEDLQCAFSSYYNYKTDKYKRPSDTCGFHKALKELDGNFVKIEKTHDSRIVAFHNPSIKDYIENRLFNDGELLSDVICSATFFDQFVRLLELNRKEQHSSTLRNNLVALHDIVLRGATKVFGSSDTRLINVITPQGERSKKRWEMYYEQRIRHAIELASINVSDNSRAFLDTIVTTYFSGIEKRVDEKDELLKMLKMLLHSPFTFSLSRTQMLTKTKKTMLCNLEYLDDYRSALEYDAMFDDHFSSDDKEHLRKEFTNYISCETNEYIDNDPDSMNQYADDLEEAAETIGINISSRLQEIRDEAYRIEASFTDDYDYGYNGQEHSTYPQRNEEEEIDAMFTTLLKIMEYGLM